MKANIIIADINPNLCEEMRRHAKGLDGVSVKCCRFEEIQEFDCMVSAANGFGLMDGGVDLAISEYFGWQLMTRVQEIIVDRYMGEQPVGSAFVIGTGMNDHPWLIHAPTMRVPRLLTGTDIPYVATWAALVELERHNRTSARPIKTIVFPGMGTGCGEVSPSHAAGQMMAAIRNYLAPRDHIDWNLAQASHNNVMRHGVIQ